MRIVLSSVKSIGKRRAICSGLQALAHRRSFRRPCRWPFHGTVGPGTIVPVIVREGEKYAYLTSLSGRHKQCVSIEVWDKLLERSGH